VKRSIVIVSLLMLVSVAMAAPNRLSGVPVQIQTKTAAVSPKRPHIAIIGAKLYTDRRHGNVGLLVTTKNIGRVPCIYAVMHLRLFNKKGKCIWATSIFAISMDREPLKPGCIRGPLHFRLQDDSWRVASEVTGASLEFEGYGGPYDPQCQGLYKH